MPRFPQGDIFQTARDGRYDLVDVFGHVGFNRMRLTRRAFRRHVSVLANIGDPFNQLAGKPHPIGDRQWLWAHLGPPTISTGY